MSDESMFDFSLLTSPVMGDKSRIELAEELDDALREAAKLSGELDKIKYELEQETKKHGKATRKCKELKKEINKLESQLTYANSQVSYFILENNLLKVTVQKQQEKITELENDKINFEGVSNQIIVINNILNNFVHSETVRFSSKMNLSRETEMWLKALRDVLKNKDETIKDLNKQLEESNKKVREGTADPSKIYTEDDLQNALKPYKDDIAKLQEELVFLTKITDILGCESKDAPENVEKIQFHSVMLQDIADELKCKPEEVLDKVKSLSVSADDLVQIAILSGCKEDASLSEIETRINELKDSKEKLDEITSTLGCTPEELKNMAARIAALETKLDETEKRANSGSNALKVLWEKFCAFIKKPVVIGLVVAGVAVTILGTTLGFKECKKSGRGVPSTSTSQSWEDSSNNSSSSSNSGIINPGDSSEVVSGVTEIEVNNITDKMHAQLTDKTFGGYITEIKSCQYNSVDGTVSVLVECDSDYGLYLKHVTFDANETVNESNLITTMENADNISHSVFIKDLGSGFEGKVVKTTINGVEVEGLCSIKYSATRDYQEDIGETSFVVKGIVLVNSEEGLQYQEISTTYNHLGDVTILEVETDLKNTLEKEIEDTLNIVVVENGNMVSSSRLIYVGDEVVGYLPENSIDSDYANE